MITYVDSDLFQSPAKVLVNPVNTVGVMGKGIAHEFKQIYPDMFRQYQDYCERRIFDVGQLWLYKTPNKWILNFPTKRHWRQKSRPEYIEAGLEKFVKTYDDKGITSIAFPLLGCGNGELDWETQVRPLMERYLQGLPITIFIHTFAKPELIPEHCDAAATRQWLREEPRILPFEEFWADLLEIIDSGHTFETLDTRASFTVTYDTERESLDFLPTRDSAFSVFKEDGGILDLWQYIRTNGYCIPDKLPAELDLNSRSSYGQGKANAYKLGGRYLAIQLK